MRLVTRLTDALVGRLAPEAAGKAAPYCEPAYNCGPPNSSGKRRCCQTYSNCDQYCKYV